MERYQVYIDGNQVRNPIGLRQFELRLKRDQDISGLLVTATNKFTFFGDGFRILQEAQDTNYNDKITTSIEILGNDGNYTEQFKGVIILSDVFLNLDKRFAETTIEDGSFQGAIQGNKNIKMFLNSNLTKNGEILTALTPAAMDFFQPSGSYTPVRNRVTYLYKDALDLLVRYMTDDEVKGIQSAYLDDVNNFGGASLPYITTGEGVRIAAPTAPNVSFAQLITFLSKTHDLTFDFVINSSGEPVMRIEDRAFFFSNTNSETIRDIKDLTQEIDVDKLASHIEVGNNKAFGTGNCSAVTRWFTFQKEDYALRGKGNIDKLIDLTTDFITDSNVIEEIVNNNNDAFDDDIVVVLGTTNGTQATKFISTSYCSNSAFYNLPWTNDNIVARQLGAMPESVTKFLVGGTSPSRSNKGTDFLETLFSISPLFPNFTVPKPVDFLLNFTDPIYDIGSNYVSQNTPTTHYDIPFEGNFTFEARVKSTFAITQFNTAGGSTPNITVTFQIAIERWNTAFTVLKEQSLSIIKTLQFGRGQALAGFPQVPIATRSRAIVHQTTMDCDVSDRIIVRVLYVSLQAEDVSEAVVNIPGLPSTSFKCLGAEEDNGVFQVFDPLTFKARLFKFKKNLSLSQGNNIRANTRDSLIINESSDPTTDKKAWIEEMNQKVNTGETNATLIN